MWAAEKLQWLKGPIILPRYLRSFSSTHIRQFTITCHSGSKGNLTTLASVGTSTHAYYPGHIHVVRTLEIWFKKHRNIVRICFYFNPRGGIWGCFIAAMICFMLLPKVWFCELQIVSAILWYLEFLEFFRRYVNTMAPIGGIGYSLLVAGVKEDTRNNEIRFRDLYLSPPLFSLSND